ncbi:MAG TPA: hypothetical protein VHT26_07590 [Trebonia sp.]|nr:hypothetical protein [Trebonia sp.]
MGSNTRESSPHQVIVIDTETRWKTSEDTEHHTIRLWQGAVTRRHGKNPSRPREEHAGGATAAELAAWIDGQVKTSPVAWLYAHNQSFDMATTRLPMLLAEYGWIVTTHNLASDAPWAILKHGNRTIRIADSHSLLPAPLAEIGEKIGHQKPPLPTNDDTDEAWHHRCRQDVEITMEALLQLMDWWDAEQLGHWSVTGPRTGFNAMRHRCVARAGYSPFDQQVGDGGVIFQHGDGHVVIDPDPDARVFERNTLYQGRREAFRTGVQPRGMYVELDIKRAHLTVAKTFKLPCRRGVRFESLSVDSPYVQGENVSVIAEVTVNTDTPRYPVKTRTGIVHPVGQFTTTLAGPEIAEARDRGELVAIGAGYYYRMSWHMQPWAIWADRCLDDTSGATPPAAKIAVKGWSRSVPGTWAARTSRVIQEGTSPVDGWHAEPGYDLEHKAPCTIVHMQGRMQILLRDVEADDSFPAILSFIQSHVRVALGRMIDQVPAERMVTCSTDSLMVDSAGWDPGTDRPYRRAVMRAAAAGDAELLAAYLSVAAEPFELAVKNVAADIRVLSPQHVRVDGNRKYSGVPGSAEEISRDVFRFLTWPKLGSQMALNVPDGYTRQARRVDMTRLTVPRWAYECGCTFAPEATVTAAGVRMTGTAELFCPRHPQYAQRERQHPALIGV